MIISATPRQSIQFGKLDARHQDDPRQPLADALALELKSAGKQQDALVLSRKAEPSDVMVQFPAHVAKNQHGKVASKVAHDQLNQQQIKLLQLVLSTLATHPALQADRIQHIEDESLGHSNEKPVHPPQERVNINFVNASGKAKVKKSETKDGLTLNIYNNLTQNNTQNAAQSGGLWNTLTSATGLNSPMGIVKMVAATGAAGLGAYYLGPKVMGYAKNRLVNAVIPENLMAQAKGWVAVPMSWLSKDGVAAAAANATETAASTATRTVSQAAGATASATLSSGASSTMDHLASQTSDFVGNVATKGWGYATSLPMIFTIANTIYQVAKRFTPAGRMSVHHHHHAAPVQDFGREIVKNGNIHSFK